MSEMVHVWKGVPIENLTEDETRKALREACETIQQERQQRSRDDGFRSDMKRVKERLA